MSYSQLYYHVIFATKYRQPLITDLLEPRLYAYMAGIIANLDGFVEEINGMPDHVHMLLGLSPKFAVADVLRILKASSSKQVNELGEFPPFAWQQGYAAFTVSYSSAPSVRQYIQGQKAHHETRDFKEEFIAFLVKHNISYRPEYLFENEQHG